MLGACHQLMAVPVAAAGAAVCLTGPTAAAYDRGHDAPGAYPQKSNSKAAQAAQQGGKATTAAVAAGVAAGCGVFEGHYRLVLPAG